MHYRDMVGIQRKREIARDDLKYSDINKYRYERQEWRSKTKTDKDKDKLYQHNTEEKKKRETVNREVKDSDWEI
jgi:hypothetical protein